MSTFGSKAPVEKYNNHIVILSMLMHRNTQISNRITHKQIPVIASSISIIDKYHRDNFLIKSKSILDDHLCLSDIFSSELQQFKIYFIHVGLWIQLICGRIRAQDLLSNSEGCLTELCGQNKFMSGRFRRQIIESLLNSRLSFQCLIMNVRELRMYKFLWIDKMTVLQMDNQTIRICSRFIYLIFEKVHQLLRTYCGRH